MRDLVLEILEKYENSQINLSSEVARTMIADEITDAIQREYHVLDSKRLWSEKDVWLDESVHPGKDDQGCDKN